jgi:cysteine synthase A
MQGWVTDFIPKLVAQAKQEGLYDNLLQADGFQAIQTSQELAQKEGIFTGISGGAMAHCALKLARESPEGTSILAILPDTAERYLSTPLFDDIPADMTEEEKTLAETTPSTPPPAAGLPEVLPEALEFVHAVNQQNKVVVWSLQYCEFCWTLTKFLDAIGVPYERIDIDNFQYAKDNMGNKYRAALQELTECKTFPQFFVNNEFKGGAVDACMLWKKEELQPMFQKAGVNNNNFNGYEGDPFEFLPKWMTQNPHRSK